MSRSRKNSDPQDTSRSPPSQDISATTLGSAFFVPTHPLLLIGTEYTDSVGDCDSQILLFPVICYGLYLTLCSAACPLSCLPSYLPLASLASHLGTHNHLGTSTTVPAIEILCTSLALGYCTRSSKPMERKWNKNISFQSCPSWLGSLLDCTYWRPCTHSTSPRSGST